MPSAWPMSKRVSIVKLRSPESQSDISREDVEDTILKILIDNEANDRETTVGELGNKLSMKSCEFKEYGKTCNHGKHLKIHQGIHPNEKPFDLEL